MCSQTPIRHSYKQNITQHPWADYKPSQFLSACWDNYANTLRAVRDLSGFGAIFYPLAHFGSLGLILQEPAGWAVTQHSPSGRAASLAKRGRFLQDGVEVGKTSRAGTAFNLGSESL